MSFHMAYGMPDSVRGRFDGDHAGKWECSMLKALFPEAVKMERHGDSDLWFIHSAVEMSEELGREIVEASVEEHLKNMG